MCYRRRDFVGGWCKNCGPSAQMFVQKVCWTSFVGPERNAVSMVSERSVYTHGMVPSPRYADGTAYCMHPQKGKDPRDSFGLLPPIQRRAPCVITPPEDYWPLESEMPQHEWGWNRDLDCIRCDPVHGELNWMYFWVLVVLPSNRPGRPCPWLSSVIWRYYMGLHSSEYVQLRPASLPFDDAMVAAKPRTIQTIRPPVPSPQSHDPRDVARFMRTVAHDAMQAQGDPAEWFVLEGRCCGGQESEGEYFDAYAEEKALSAAEAIAAMNLGADAGEGSADQQVHAMYGIDYDRTDDERNAFLAENEGEGQKIHPHPADMDHPQDEEDVHPPYDRRYGRETILTWDDEGNASFSLPQPHDEHEQHQTEEPTYDPDDYSDYPDGAPLHILDSQGGIAEITYVPLAQARQACQDGLLQWDEQGYFYTISESVEGEVGHFTNAK